MKRSLILILTLCTLTPPAHADINSANEALTRGDYATAVAEFKKLAEAGNPMAQANLGYMYYVGEGVSQDYSEAVNWYRKAAVQGNRDAQYNLAVAYAFGEGVEQDLKESSIWYRRAAEQGHMLSQYSLGISYAYGEGVPQDATEAVRWFRMAAEQGYARAQVQIGSMYHTGEGVKQDYVEAVRWYRMAADRGDATAQYNLGAMYRSGKGVDQDYTQAKRWYRMAADQGYAAAQNELASLERTPTAAITQQSMNQQKPGTSTAAETPSVQASFDQEDQKSKTSVPETVPAVTQTEAATETQDSEVLLTIDKDTLLSLEETPAATEKADTESSVTEPAVETEFQPAASAETATAETKSSGGLFGTLGKFFSPKKSQKEQGPAREIVATTATIETTSTEVSTAPALQADPPTTGTGVAMAEEAEAMENLPAATVKEPEYGPVMESAQSGAEDTTLEESSATVTAGSTVAAATKAEPVTEVKETYPIQTNPLFGGAPVTTAVSEDKKPTGGLFGRLGKLFKPAKDEPAKDEERPDDDTLLAVAEPDAALPGDQGLVHQVEETLVPSSVDAGRSALARGDYTGARDQFLPLATQGDAEAQAHLGSMYYVGKGVEQDYGKAYDWYRRAAEQGNVDAQYSIGNMYLLGEGIAQDNDKAAEWYARAAEQGHATAQYNLDNLNRLASQQEAEKTTTATAQAETTTETEQAGPKTTKEKSGGLFGFLGGLFTSDRKPAGESLESADDVPEQPDTALSEASSPETVATAYPASTAPTGAELTPFREEQSAAILEDEQGSTDAENPPAAEVVDSKIEDTGIVTNENTMSDAQASPEIKTVTGTGSRSGFFDKLFGTGAGAESTETMGDTDDTASDEYMAGMEGTGTATQTDSMTEPGTDNVNTEIPVESVMDQQDESAPAEIAETTVSVPTGEESVTKPGRKSGFFSKLFGRSADKEKPETETEVVESGSNGEDQASMQAMLDVENHSSSPGLETNVIPGTIGEGPVAGSLDEGIAAIEAGNYEKALTIIRPLAVAGDINAQYQLGILYYRGEGVKQDYTQASLWYRRAAELGHTDAQYSLGNMYLMGEGNYQDDNEAARWYAKAAENGHVAAAHNLQNLNRSNEETTAGNEVSETGTQTPTVANREVMDSTTRDQPDEGNARQDYERGLAYAFGDNVTQDDDIAFKWFLKSADQGYAPAQYKVGVAYAYGEGVDRDPSKAVDWYRKAADQGYIIAQRNLALLYLNGEGVEQDKIQALAWYNIVAVNGNAMDIRRRDTLKNELSETQLRQSEALASELSSRMPN